MSEIKNKITFLKGLYILISLNFIVLGCYAQQPIYIPPSANVFSYPSDSVSIFGDIINQGNFGSTSGSVINFYGANWTNDPLSLLPGQNATPGAAGGLFRFLGTKSQFVAGGFNLTGETGPSFPNIAIENTSGVWLADLNDLHIRGKLQFRSGYLYLNGWNARVDDSITGYSQKSFVVTGQEIGGGSLYLTPPPRDSLAAFPVGTDPNSYSPLALKASDPFAGPLGARVFDHVFQNGNDGNIKDSDYVIKTFQLSSAQGKAGTTVLIQHNEADEGVRFGPYRDSSYVSQFAYGYWDIDTLPHHFYGPGTITTAKPERNTHMNDRFFPKGLPHAGVDSVTWLSVSTTGFSNYVCPMADFKLWVAQRYSYQWVQLFWRTTREMNLVAYEVQRRRDTSADFKTIATIPSKGINGFSDHLLYYYYADDNTYDGWTYYRLKLTSMSGCVVYTGIQSVPWGIGIDVWPNPSPGITHIRVLGITHPIIMQVVDTWGQIIRKYTVGNDLTVDLSDLAAAPYFLVFYDPKNHSHQFKTVKLIIQHTR